MSDSRDEFVDEEEAAAAAEAAAIGGRPSRELEGDLPDDPAMQAVYEGGGGEAEGFEIAEAELVEHAEHGPARPEGEVRVREEVDRETEEVDPATYGEPDQEDVTELTSDPGEGPDDPGAGPDIAASR
jgi:hypothetical protein